MRSRKSRSRAERTATGRRGCWQAAVVDAVQVAHNGVDIVVCGPVPIWTPSHPDEVAALKRLVLLRERLVLLRERRVCSLCARAAEGGGRPVRPWRGRVADPLRRCRVFICIVEERKEFVGQFTQTLLKNAAQRNASNLGGGQRGMVRQHKSWDDILLEEREENSRLRQQQRDQAERERRLVERLTQLKEQQSALQQGKTVDAVGRDGKIKALQVRACTPCPRLRDCRPAGDGGGEWRDA